jgi:hypothetical protein
VLCSLHLQSLCEPAEGTLLLAAGPPVHRCIDQLSGAAGFIFGNPVTPSGGACAEYPTGIAVSWHTCMSLGSSATTTVQLVAAYEGLPWTPPAPLPFNLDPVN